VYLAAMTLVGAGAAAIVVSDLADWVDWRGTLFFRTGESIAQQLGRFDRAIVAQDTSAVTALYAADFRGTALGLDRLSSMGEKDGIERFRFDAPATVIGRDGAADEWRRYFASFTSIVETKVRLDRIEQWGPEQQTMATLRVDVLGSGRTGLSVTDRLVLHANFSPGLRAPVLASAALVEGERLLSAAPQFRDVGGEAGIAFKNRYYPPFLTEPLRFGMIRYGPGGIAAVDYDDDGFYDLFIPDGVESKLFRNTHDGRFVDVTAAAGLSGLDGVSVGVFADYDNDGHKDLFVSRTFRPNQLFHNNGDGTFTDVTSHAGLGADCCTTAASWADYDNDGFLDLYVGRYLDPRKTIPTTFYARNGEPNQLYHNNGDGTFTNVTARTGVGDTGLCLGTVWGDYDNDGFPDLYVVNDFGRSTLYHNNRNGTFADVTVATNTLAYGAGMSASFVDFDNDGLFDFYTTDIRSDSAWFAESPTVHRYMVNSFRQGVWTTDMPLYFQMFRQSGFAFTDIFRKMASGNTLLRNRGDGTFEDVTMKANANPPGWFWGASFADFDNDGWQDIYIADGWVKNDPGTDIELEFLNNVVSEQREYKKGTFFDPRYFGRRSWHGWDRNRHLLSNGDGTFREIGHAAGTDLTTNSRGVAVADFWNRGRLDIAVAASDDRHLLLRNEIPQSRHWLDVELMGTRSNRDAVGARVSVRAGALVQSREVGLGDGYGSQNTLRLHFGLGDVAQVDELRVRWPASGTTQVFHNTPIDQVLMIVEGRDALGVRP
jgi:hypothetical protein